MDEWIVFAAKPTRAMERMKLGEVVLCKYCGHLVLNGTTGCWCTKLSREVGPRDFCSCGVPCDGSGDVRDA